MVTACGLSTDGICKDSVGAGGGQPQSIFPHRCLGLPWVNGIRIVMDNALVNVSCILKHVMPEHCPIGL